MMKRLLQLLAWFLLVLGFIISVLIVIRAYSKGIRISGIEPIDFSITGQFGDFIGGVVGTIISAAGFIFLYLTFKEQRESFAKERFESKFFELIKLHRDNVSELKYTEGSDATKSLTEGRKVFRIIFHEFLECLKEVRNFSSVDVAEYYVQPNYLKELKAIIEEINPSINLYKLITIDIAFCITFYGVGEEGSIILRRIFLHKYNDPYFYKLINYIQQKPKKWSPGYQKWLGLNSLEMDIKLGVLEEAYAQREGIKKETLTPQARGVLITHSYEKFYGGHQHRLGHYFRHLFQSYKYLNSQEILNPEEKYFYGKMLRAQLSTYEQALLLVDSLSSLGMKWEYTPEYYYDKRLSIGENLKRKENARLITKYNLIKNLPGDKFLDIKFKDFYPKVNYEFFEQV